MPVFTGSGVALCTPFDKSGAFCHETYDKLIEFHAKKGTEAIVACGTTGEAATLTEDECVEVVRIAVASAKKHGDNRGHAMTVIAGAGGNDTTKCKRIGKALQKVGADCLMYVTPYYNKTSQAGLVAHYSALAASVDLPIMVYNVPSRTGVNMLPKTMAELAKIPNITAIKEASGDISQIAEMAERLGDDAFLYAGNDDQILPILILGGMGVVSTIANIAPDIVQNIVVTFFMNEIPKSRSLQLGILPLVRLLFADVNPMPVKAALELMGYRMGSCRLPLTSISDALSKDLEQEMRQYGLLT